MPLMVTGHRKLVPAGWTGNPWPADNPPIQRHHIALYHKIYTHVEAYASTGDAIFITGMAIGADQLFANAVIRLLDSGVMCRLIAAVPFEGQDKIWPPRGKEIYRSILKRCEVTYVSTPGYAAWKMQKRNKWMVDRATNVLAIWDGKQVGGTYNAIQEAKRCGKKITIVSPT